LRELLEGAVKYFEDSHTTLHLGDCREVLRGMEAESVQCVVTSPPYWGLRNYGVEGQLGLEPTPDLYVEHMVKVFREVRRVLRKDGTVWLNLGDSHAGGGNNNGNTKAISEKQGSNRGNRYEPKPVPVGLKPKDLVGIPWRVAFALQADGWWLRSDIVWSKPNPMPESVQDRPTRSHEYVFLLSKSAKYYYDSAAIREPLRPSTAADSRLFKEGYETGRPERGYPGSASNGSGLLQPRRDKQRGHGRRHDGFNDRWDAMTKDEQQANGANKRTVWEIATQPYPEAHFATFPEALVRPCVLAGTSEAGECVECGAPWERVTERPKPPDDLRNRDNGAKMDFHTRQVGSGQKLQDWYDANPTQTTGWRPTCKHEAGTRPQVILDPFGGSGTVAVVARRAGRRAVLIDVKEDYLRMARDRIRQAVLL